MSDNIKFGEYYLCKKSAISYFHFYRGTYYKAPFNYGSYTYKKNVMYKIIETLHGGSFYLISEVGYIPINDFSKHFCTKKHLLLEKNFIA